MSELTIRPPSSLPALGGLPAGAQQGSTAARTPDDAPAVAGSPLNAIIGPDDASAPSTTELLDAVSRLQEFIQPVARDLLFSIDDDTGHTVVKIVDRQTEEVIKQVPSEEFLSMARALDKLRGLLVKQEV